MKKKILVLGQNGQLARTLISELKKKKIPYLSLPSKIINFEYPDRIISQLKKYSFNLIVNCFAYTDVDRAEIDKKKSYKINYESVKKLSDFCKKKEIVLIHFSTDYIFSGKFKKPILENSRQQPLNYYGYTKVKSEKAIINSGCNYLIIRISWTYSLHGKNFVKTIIKKLKQREQLNIVNDQFGCPTNLHHFVKVVVKLINFSFKNKLNNSNIFNYSHNGVTSWYKFAKKIEKKIYPKSKSLITPISSRSFSSRAKRPKYSKLSNKKISKFLKIKKQYDWIYCLNDFLKKHYL